MKMNYNLTMLQTQKLIMTPELKQAIEILQYSALELSEFVEQRLMENPILERNEEEVQLPQAEEVRDKKIDWDEFTSYFEDGPKVRSESSNREEAPAYDYYLMQEESLEDFLMLQLSFAELDEPLHDIVQYLILNIDNNGYLKGDAIESCDRFNCDMELFNKALSVVQGFEPYGVGGRDIKECLLIQLKHQGYEDSLCYDIVENHLDELASNGLAKLSKAYAVPAEDIQEAFDVIRALEPKPGSIYASAQQVRYIVPDVFLRKIGGEYMIIMNDNAVPRLRISKYYRQMLKSGENQPIMEYLEKNMGAALRIIKSIEQRRNTIYKVIESILKHQFNFFEHGKLHLKSMNLKDVADEISVHESTVSRAVNGKYLQCDQGLFELKFFFQSGVSSDYGDQMSSLSIKTLINELIEGENPKKPLSDQKITDALVKRGVNISRRTVAKYRDELGVLSASKRKRL